MRDSFSCRYQALVHTSSWLPVEPFALFTSMFKIVKFKHEPDCVVYIRAHASRSYSSFGVSVCSLILRNLLICLLSDLYPVCKMPLLCARGQHAETSKLSFWIPVHM